METKKDSIFLIKNLFSYLILFLLSINLISAQDENVTECPYFSLNSTDTSGVVFSLESTDINATVSGVIASVSVQQTYVNAGDSIVDATYVFPMSTNAAIYAMEMILNERTIVAEIKRRDEAEMIFENADSLGLTATLLEQERPNVFQMSLANINPGDTLSVRMLYTELLVPNHGVYQFVFPNIVGPRFTQNSEDWVTQTALDSASIAETSLNINLKINSGMPLRAECVSHSSNFNYEGNSAETTLSTNPGADFIVNYTLDDDQIETGLLLYEGAEENFFLSMIQPAKPEIDFNSPPREYVFIMDVSGSMNGTPIEISKNLLTNLLNDLNGDDRFNILFFAGGSSALAPNSLPVSLENIALAIEMIDNITASGSTLLLPAMETALEMDGTDRYSRTFVILTDGFVTVEKEAYDLIRQNLNSANFFSFGIGSSVNRFIIEGIAYVGEGEPFIASTIGDAEQVADRFKEYIEKPVLTNIEVEFDGIDVYDVEPFSIPDVFAERPIIICGKYNSTPNGTIFIEGDYAEGIVSASQDFAEYTDNMDENIALKYLWARKKIKLMSDYGIASNENDSISIEEEITLLGLKYNLVTEFTSFVAVDSSATVTSGGNIIEEDNTGISVDVADLIIHSKEKQEIIQVFGTIIDEDNILHLKLINLEIFQMEGLSLRIINTEGHIISEHPVHPNDLETTKSLSMTRQLTSGVYFISLMSESNVLDTEKFIVR